MNQGTDGDLKCPHHFLNQEECGTGSEQKCPRDENQPHADRVLKNDVHKLVVFLTRGAN